MFNLVLPHNNSQYPHVIKQCGQLVRL